MKDEAGSERTFAVDELAELCGLPANVVQRWVDRGLLSPMRGSVRRFAFRSIGAVRTLAELWRAGWSAPRIARAWRARAAPSSADPDAALTGLLASIGNEARHRARAGRPADRADRADGVRLRGARQEAESAAAVAAAAQRAGLVCDRRRCRGRGTSRRRRARLRARGCQVGSAETHFNLGNCYYELQTTQGRGRPVRRGDRPGAGLRRSVEQPRHRARRSRRPRRGSRSPVEGARDSCRTTPTRTTTSPRRLPASETSSVPASTGAPT